VDGSIECARVFARTTYKGSSVSFTASAEIAHATKNPKINISKVFV